MASRGSGSQAKAPAPPRRISSLLHRVGQAFSLPGLLSQAVSLLSFGSAILILQAALAQCAMAAPFRNIAPGTRYLGSKVCAGCHSRIYATFIKTGMGRSMLAGADPTLSERFPVPATLFDRDSNQYFQVFRKQEALYQSQYAVDSDGKEIFRQTFPVAYVVGSGENGFGFVVQRGAYLFEAPLTYYTKSKTWGFSPGYELRNHAFKRPVLAQCIACHSGRPQPVPNRVAAYRDPPFVEVAVGCENCHGPGALHVAERQTGRAPAPGADTSIVNPAHLTGWLADNICMKCHQGGDVRVEQPGGQEQDFRPGTPLEKVLAIFKAPLDRASEPQSVLLEHYFAMTLSKCYRASAGSLRCTSCHNPHEQLSGGEAAAYYRTKCLGCHTPASCKLPMEERRKKSTTDDCTSCHMPKRTVTTITHAALTDHSIAARPGEPYPQEAFQSRFGLLDITAAPGQPPANVPPVTLLQAYLSLIREGRQEFTPRMNELLDHVAHAAPENRIILAAMARRAISTNTPASLREAAGYLTRVVQAGSTAPEDFLLLAELDSRDNRHEDAIRVLEQGRVLNPYFAEFYESMAAQQMALGKYGEALKVIRKGLELFTDDMALRALEKQVRSATLDGSVVK